MSRIEQIKKQGMINELNSQIDLIIWQLRNDTFKNIKSNEKFDGLKIAIDNARMMIKEIEDLLNALKELDEKVK